MSIAADRSKFYMRHFIALLFLVLSVSASAQQSEYLIVSGGPALRKWEDLRRAGEQHVL